MNSVLGTIFGFFAIYILIYAVIYFVSFFIATLLFGPPSDAGHLDPIAPSFPNLSCWVVGVSAIIMLLPLYLDPPSNRHDQADAILSILFAALAMYVFIQNRTPK